MTVTYVHYLTCVTAYYIYCIHLIQHNNVQYVYTYVYFNIIVNMYVYCNKMHAKMNMVHTYIHVHVVALHNLGSMVTDTVTILKNSLGAVWET